MSNAQQPITNGNKENRGGSSAPQALTTAVPEGHSKNDSVDADNLRTALRHFTGTENLYGLGVLFRNAVYTDGVHFLIQAAQCAWFVTDSMAWVTQKVPGQNYDDGFMTVELHPKADGGAELLITDGNGKTLYNQRYTSHSFPLGEGIKLYAVWGETSRGPCWYLMLTSEY
ncbi:hypothetical protein KDW61_20900 [Burkholderia cenocepacia]|uniref:DUF6876 family protein n=1 Tax=Burkholderia cenocepacia TaxID=95486 RepID=UPI001BA21A87|nr:DUF6876 family protein [Burkholderia cenocepacia]MBR8211123.1 hypothetical protein [Burkholderia cenocepacia]